jgi:lactoylglutathione lyase
MTLEHIAIWTNHLELLKDFYVKFLNGTSSAKYVNLTNNFESYFISFQNGARLELMQKPGIVENLNSTVEQYLGIIHLAFEVKDMAEVDRQSVIFQDAGYTILKGPRKTGDGYYEFETLDPDNNRLEIFAPGLDGDIKN